MKVLFATFSLALASLFAVSAFAAEEGAMAACKADMEKLCPGVKPGDGQVKACFKQHKDQVSAECKKELAAARKQRKAG
jgi:hypothetical protein